MNGCSNRPRGLLVRAVAPLLVSVLDHAEADRDAENHRPEAKRDQPVLAVEPAAARRGPSAGFGAQSAAAAGAAPVR